MMLVLFVGLANNQVITEGDLIEITGTGEAAGRRWITHLLRDGQVAERCDDDDVSHLFSPKSETSVADG